ncbi:unnamed protein product [Caenorhabditis brenneri]
MNTSFLSTPDFLSQSFKMYSIIEIPVHILGTYCILFKTPKSMESVKWNMLTIQVFSMISDFMFSVFVCPFFVFPVFAGEFLGIFSDFGVPPGIQVYLMFTAIFFVSAAIVCLFENRFYLLCAKTSWWRCARYPFLVAQYIMAFSCFVPVILLIPDQKPALEVLQKKFPQIPFSQYSPSLSIISSDGSAPFYSIVITGTMTWYENSVPFLTLVLPAFYFRFSMNWSYYNQFLNNLCMIMVSLHGVMSTIMMILVHDPYRNAVKSMMDLRGFWRN